MARGEAAIFPPGRHHRWPRSTSGSSPVTIEVDAVDDHLWVARFSLLVTKALDDVPVVLDGGRGRDATNQSQDFHHPSPSQKLFEAIMAGDLRRTHPAIMRDGAR